jgi:uncharacterized membrane protein YqiK
MPMDEKTLSTELQKFSVTDAAIAKAKKNYMVLTISGLEDAEGYKLVHESRMKVKSKRVEVEKTRKELKADALAYGKAVDARAKEITTQLEEIENYLYTQEKVIDDEKEAIRTKAKREQEEKERIERERIEAERQAEIDRINKEQEVERLRLAEIERKQEEERRKIKEEQERLDREKRRLEEIERERKHREELEITCKEAVEKNKKEAELQAERDRQAELIRAENERLAAIEKEKKTQVEKERIEAAKPDIERLMEYADRISVTEVPAMSTKEGKVIAQGIKDLFQNIVEYIHDEVAKISDNKEEW